MVGLAWPLVLSQFLQSALFTTNIYVLAQLGPTELAAATVAASFIMPSFLFGSHSVAVVAPLMAQARGAGNTRAIADYLAQGIILGLLLAGILWLVLS